MRAGESFGNAGQNALAATSSTFVLDGGKYWFAAVGTFSSATATLQKIGPDGATLVTPITGLALTQAGGVVTDLPPGTYQVTISGGTPALFWEVVRVNEE